MDDSTGVTLPSSSPIVIQLTRRMFIREAREGVCRASRLYHNKYSSNVLLERKKKEEFPKHAAFLLIVGERKKSNGRCLILLGIFNYSRWQGANKIFTVPGSMPLLLLSIDRRLGRLTFRHCRRLFYRAEIERGSTRTANESFT